MPLSSSFDAYFGGTTELHGLIQSSISCDPDRQNKRVRQNFKKEKGIDLTYGVIQCQTTDDHTAVQSKTNTIKCHHVSQSLDAVNKHSFKEEKSEVLNS